MLADTIFPKERGDIFSAAAMYRRWWRVQNEKYLRFVSPLGPIHESDGWISWCSNIWVNNLVHLERTTQSHHIFRPIHSTPPCKWDQSIHSQLISSSLFKQVFDKSHHIFDQFLSNRIKIVITSLVAFLFSSPLSFLFH